jgi:hypothetical protein
MTHLELSTIDQTGILFLVFSAIGLIRERRVLPFVLVLAGTIFQGAFAAVLVAGLVVWHRLDRNATKWIQVKDMLGLVFVLGSAFSSETLQSFLTVFGVFLLTVNLGGGLLGTLPALALLRQYHPHPEYLELALGGAGIYWVAAEVFRWTKFDKEREALSYLEAFGAAILLVNYRADIERILEDTLYLGVGGSLLVLEAALFFWLRFKPRGFLSFYQSTRGRLVRALTAGSKWVGGREPWSGSKEEAPALDFDLALERVFYLFLTLVFSAGVFIVLARGGLG